MFMLVLGCAPRVSNIAPPIEEPKQFSQTGQSTIDNKWWTVFQDEELNSLIDSAMLHNFDLAATWQQFQAAKAIVSREASNKWPQIDASAQTAENFPINDFRGGENTQLSMSASYELDLWGRINSAVQAEKLRAEANLFDYRTAAISLSAEIATTWYQLLAAKSNYALQKTKLIPMKISLNLCDRVLWADNYVQ